MENTISNGFIDTSGPPLEEKLSTGVHPFVDDFLDELFDFMNKKVPSFDSDTIVTYLERCHTKLHEDIETLMKVYRRSIGCLYDEVVEAAITEQLEDFTRFCEQCGDIPGALSLRQRRGDVRAADELGAHETKHRTRRCSWKSYYGAFWLLDAVGRSRIQDWLSGVEQPNGEGDGAGSQKSKEVKEEKKW